MDLFDYMRKNTIEQEAPLASRLRPSTLDEVVGQKHIIGKDKLLYRAIQADKLGSLIFYGPPGTGKTTLVAALVVKNNLYIVNIGDSRLYVITDSSITQITKDHSLVQYLLDSGKLTPAEAQNYPKKNIITRAVGIEMDIEADIFSVNLAGTRKGYILLCSDGLTNFVKLEEISSIVTAPAASDADIPTLLEQKAANLINRANEAGGSDNITAVLIEYNSSN